jgi:hypothetical protein
MTVTRHMPFEVYKVYERSPLNVAVSVPVLEPSCRLLKSTVKLLNALSRHIMAGRSQETEKALMRVCMQSQEMHARPSRLTGRST